MNTPNPTFSKSKVWQLRLLSPLINTIVKLLASTWTKRFANPDTCPKLAPAGQKNFIFAIWHTNCFSSLLTHTHLPISIIVSRSFDGELISNLVHSFRGMDTIRGSSSRGGKEALETAFAAVDEGRILGITVDGPRGPRFKAKLGAVRIAREKQIPIVTMFVGSRHYWQLKSWDRFRIPKPFTRLTVHYGEPFHVPATADDTQLMEYNEKLEQSLAYLETLVENP